MLSEFPFLYRFTVLLNSGGSNSPWCEFWSEFPRFMGMGVVPAPSNMPDIQLSFMAFFGSFCWKTPMPIKFLLLGGGVLGFFRGGGGSAYFIFMGVGIFPIHAVAILRSLDFLDSFARAIWTFRPRPRWAKSPIASVQRTRSTLADHSAVPCGRDQGRANHEVQTVNWNTGISILIYWEHCKGALLQWCCNGQTI